MLSYFFKQAGDEPRAPIRAWSYEGYFEASRSAIEAEMARDRECSLKEILKAEIEMSPRGKLIGGVLLDHVVRVSAKRTYPQDINMNSIVWCRHEREMPRPIILPGHAEIVLHLVSGEVLAVAGCTIAGSDRHLAAYDLAIKTGETQTSEPAPSSPNREESRHG